MTQRLVIGALTLMVGLGVVDAAAASPRLDVKKAERRVKSDIERGTVDIDAGLLNTAAEQRLIATDVAKQLPGKIKVDCRDLIAPKKGDTEICHVTAGAKKVDIKVTFTNDQGTFIYKQV